MAQEDFKQVIIIRSDLRMGRGKIAVQVAHAAIMASETVRNENPHWWEAWMAQGQRKVAVKIDGESKIFDLALQARNSGIPTAIVRDSGLTQLEPGTVTCLGIGPAPVSLVDMLTSELQLL